VRYYLIIFTFILVSFSQKIFAQDFGSDKEMVAIHGFVSQGYMQSSDNNFYGNTIDGTFKFNEFGLNFSSQVTENLHIGMQLFSRNLGYLGGSQIVIDWAYGDYLWKDWLGIRAGKIKMPLGFYNETRDVDMLRTNIFMPQGVYNDGWRSTFNAIQGVGGYGNITIPFIGNINYQAQVGVLNISTKSGSGKYMNDQLYSTFNQINVSTTYVGSIIWETPLNGLRLGISGFRSDMVAHGVTNDTKYWRMKTQKFVQKITHSDTLPSYEDARKKADLVGMNITQEAKNTTAIWLSAEYIWEHLTISAEYFQRTRDIKTYNTMKPEMVFNNKTKTMCGYYGNIAYQFTDWLEVGSYYTEYYPNADDKDGKLLKAHHGLPESNAWYKDAALSFKFSINSNWTAKLEGHKINGTAIMYRSDQPNPNKVTEDWYLFAAKFTFNF
jgi:hypothetical protein